MFVSFAPDSMSQILKATRLVPRPDTRSPNTPCFLRPVMTLFARVREPGRLR